MLKTDLLHPGILGGLAACGHGDRILIADGNYPIASEANPNAERFYLGLRPGVPTVTEVLETLASTVSFEQAEVMTPGPGQPEPEIFKEFRSTLALEDLGQLSRFDFYDAVKAADNLRLVINTGELRVFANLLLTIGVRPA